MTRPLPLTVALAAGAALFASACASDGVVTRSDPSSAGTQVVRSSTNEPTYADIRSVAERLIDEMLSKGVLAKRAEQAQTNPFRIAVKYVSNQTSSDRISTDQFLNIIEESLLQTGIVRVFEKDSPDWEYSLDAVLDSTRATAGNRQQTIFKLTLTMTSIKGEKIGIWSEEIQLDRTK